jgi:N-methylhydantoinase B
VPHCQENAAGCKETLTVSGDGEQVSVAGQIDAVTLAILKGRLEQIADEMDATLFRAAFNPIIAEAHDACHGLYHAASGHTLVQGKSGLPIFVGTMAFAVKAVIDKAARQGGPSAGDTWIFNDPYEGGSHLNDVKLVRPYFRDGRVFCWLASVGHWLDVGGNVAGNYNPGALEAFQEGVVIPPVRLIERGVLRQDVVDIWLANSRVPDSNFGDLYGQINALDLGEKRMDALLDEYGAATVQAALDELYTRAGRLMRSHIAALPPGTYRFEDCLDNDGIVDRPIRIALDMTVTGDRLRLDFSRSDPACQGPLNISRATTIAACYVALKHVFPDVPASFGCLEPVEIVIPEASVLAANAPKPVGGYTETILRLICAVFGAAAQAAPERACGAPFGAVNALSMAGHRANGESWVLFCFFGGGLGGTAEGDGLHHGNNPISTATMPPVEIMEAAYPVMFTQFALRPDSGGPGRHRGGVGAVYEIELLDAHCNVAVLGDRGRFPPFGVRGGRHAARNRIVYPTAAGPTEPPMASKIANVPLARGERIRIESPGGGGWGNPGERDPAQVREDLRLGYITADGARHDYGSAS